MKRILLLSAAACLITALIVVSCKKKTDNQTTYDPSHLNEYFAGLRSTPQNFNVQAGRDTIIFGADTTMIHFYPNSFKDASGNVVTNGTINVQLIEMYKPGDMISNRTSTIAEGKLIQSGGQTAISATMNGQKVFANKYALGFKQSGYSSQPMELFYGNNNNADSSTTWTEGNNGIPGTQATKTVLQTFWDTVNNRHYTMPYTVFEPWYYVFDSCSSFGGVNCDQFYNDTSNKTDVVVKLTDESFNGSNTIIYFVVPSAKLNIRMDYLKSSNSYDVSEAGGGFGVPVGKNYELAVIGNKNGNYYFYETSGVITQNMTLNAALAPETLGDIKARLQGL